VWKLISMNFTLVERLPTPEEYNDLRRSVGWPTFEKPSIIKALQSSLFVVLVSDTNRGIIGMARVIGDGAIYFHVQDVIVHPEVQRIVIGQMLMDAVMKYIDAHCVAGSNVGLMCSVGRENFYTRYGFIARPTDKYGAGMIQVK